MIQNQASAQGDAKAEVCAHHRGEGELKIRAYLSKPKSQNKEINSETKDGQGGGGEENPVWFASVGDLTKEKDLQNGKGKSKKCATKDRKTKQGGNCKYNIGKEDQSMMQRHGAFPGEIAEQGGALIFFVGSERGEVDDKKICERERGQWNDNDDQQAMILFGLKKESDGWNDVSDVHGEGQLAKAAIEQADRRNSIGKNEDDGGKKKEERWKNESLVEKKEI